MTAMKEAFQRANYDGTDGRLYVAAVEAARSADGDLDKSAAILEGKCKNDPALLRAALRHYLESTVLNSMNFARDGRAKQAPLGQRRIAASREAYSDGGQGAVAPRGAKIEMPSSDPVEDDGPAGGATSAIRPLPSSSPVETLGAVAGVPQGRQPFAPDVSPSDASGADDPVLLRRGSYAPDASPPHDRAGREFDAVRQGMITRPVVNPPRGASAMASVNKTLSVFDTFKVRDGRPIGDLTIGEARVIAATNEREASILRELIGKVQNVPPGVTLREIIKPFELAEAMGRNQLVAYV